MLKNEVTEDRILKILRKNSDSGLTITELVRDSKFSRSAIRTALAKLDGAGNVSVRKVGMAKVYSLRNRKGKENKRVFLFLVFFSIFLLNTSLVPAPGITGVVRPQGKSVKQLFDISFELDSSIVLDIKDLVARVTFESFGTEPTEVGLTFIILDEIGSQVYSEKDSLVVETEKIFTKEFENLDLEIGKYTIILNTLYNEDVEDGFWKEFEIRSRVGKSPNQLFDIRFELEDSLIKTNEKLVSRVIFESFGTEPTGVDMEFIFLDGKGEEVYSEKDFIIVETEKVLTKEFEGFRFEEGEYTFVLKTLYNVDVEDEFRRKFEVKEEVSYRFRFFVSALLNMFLMGSIWLLLRKQEMREGKHGRK